MESREEETGITTKIVGYIGGLVLVPFLAFAMNSWLMWWGELTQAWEFAPNLGELIKNILYKTETIPSVTMALLFSFLFTIALIAFVRVMQKWE